MAEAEDLARAIAAKVMALLDTPREERRELRRKRRRMREPWSGRWFGLLPLALRFWLRRMRVRKR